MQRNTQSKIPVETSMSIQCLLGCTLQNTTLHTFDVWQRVQTTTPLSTDAICNFMQVQRILHMIRMTSDTMHAVQLQASAFLFCCEASDSQIAGMPGLPQLENKTVCSSVD